MIHQENMMVGLAWSKSVMNHHISSQSAVFLHNPQVGFGFELFNPLKTRLKHSQLLGPRGGFECMFLGFTAVLPLNPPCPIFLFPWPNSPLECGFGMIWEPHAGHLDIMKYLLDKRADPAAKASSVHDRKKGELVLPGVHR